MAYVPGKARAGEPTPQTHPELFSDDEIKAEVKYLLYLNKRHGTHHLRVGAYTKLLGILAERSS